MITPAGNKGIRNNDPDQVIHKDSPSSILRNIVLVA